MLEPGLAPDLTERNRQQMLPAKLGSTVVDSRRRSPTEASKAINPLTAIAIREPLLLTSSKKDALESRPQKPDRPLQSSDVRSTICFQPSEDLLLRCSKKINSAPAEAVQHKERSLLR